MTVERWIRLIAGSFILVSLASSQVSSRHWLWFTAFVGANLLQSALTRWCLLENILRRLGVGEGTRVTAGEPGGASARGRVA